MKRLIAIFLFGLFASHVHAGLWDDWFGGDEEESVDTTTQQAPSTTDAMVQQGLQLLPLLVQQLGVTETQASGGMGALLQAAMAMLSKGEGQSLMSAIPNAAALMGAAPSKKSSDSSMLSGALEAAGEYNETAKVASQLNSQFKSLGMSTDMIPKFTDTTKDYLSKTGKPDAANLLSSALSSIL